MKEKLNAIRNKFILLGIKVKDFCMNHKIATGALALLLVSAIVVSVLVSAADVWTTASFDTTDDRTKIQLAGPSVSDPDSFDSQERAYNFSTVYYNLDYYLKNSSGENLCTTGSQNTYYVDDVTIIATLGQNDQAIWNETDETTISELSSDRKTLTAHVSNVQACTGQQQVLALTILNSAKVGSSATITPSVKIKAGSATTSFYTFESVPTITTVATDDVELTAKVQAGIPRSENSTKVGKFGIALGIDGSSASYSSLKGKYISNADAIYMYANQDTATVDLKTGTNANQEAASANGDFAAYTEAKKYFNPLIMPELSTSGYTKSLNQASDESSQKESVVFYGVKPLEYDLASASVNLLIDDTYVVDGDTRVKCGSTGACRIINTLDQSVAGTGNITYTYTKGNDVYEYKRKVTINSTSGAYGPKKVELYKNNTAEVISSIATLNGIETSNITICNTDGSNCNYNYSTLASGEYKLKDGENVITTITVIDTEQSQELTADNIEIPKSITISKRESYDVCNSISGFTNCNVVSSNLNPNAVGSYTSRIQLGKTWTSSAISGNSYTVTYDQSASVTKSLYKLSINDIAYNGSLTKIAASNFYALGTYFVTTAAIPNITETAQDVCLTAFTETESNKKSACIDADIIKGSKNGSNTPYNYVYVQEDGSYVRAVDSENYYTAAMGEEIEQELIFAYGYDAANKLTELVAIAPYNKTYVTPIAYNDTIEGDTLLNKNFAFVDFLNEDISGSSSEISGSLDYQVRYVNSANNEEYDPANLPANASYDRVKVKVTSTAGIEQGTNVRIRIKYKVNSLSKETYESLAAAGNNKFKFASEKFYFKTAASQSTTYTETYPDSANVYITPYKLRFNSKFGKKDDETQEPVLKDIDELTFDASKNDTYTMAVFPDVISPTMDVSSSAFGYSAVESVPLKVTLPKGVSYVYNKNYTDVVPKVTYNSDGTTTLSYTYYGVEPNSWIEPLKFDFNIDVDASTSHESTSSNPYKIRVEIGDSNNKTSIMSDYSSDLYKTATYPLSIENTYDVAYGQYLYNTTNESTRHYVSNVDANESFVHTMKLKNNKNTTANNVYAYAVLPNPQNSTITNYNGTFEVSIPSLDSVSGTGIDEIKCAYSVDGLTNSEVAMASTTWTTCNGSENLSGYRIHYNSLAVDAEKEFSVTYTVKDNSAADVYEFHSYVAYDNASRYIAMHPLALEVISKKIKGYVFEDFVVNGIWDDSENPIEGVVLKLYDSNNSLVKTTTSNKQGLYVFSGLSEGSYFVVAEFNNEKYGLTTIPSQDYYDKSKISVFKEDKTSTESSTTIPGIKTDEIKIVSETRVYDYVNLGLTPRKIFKAKINKYVSKAIITDALGVQTTKDFKNAKIAKLDVRNLDKVSIKVIYTLEIQNTMYYPGYVKKITEMVPDGMTFNKKYSENKGWTLLEDGTLENTTLAGVELKENEKKYIKVAFDITSKEAGSFVNTASIDELQILGGATDE